MFNARIIIWRIIKEENENPKDKTNLTFIFRRFNKFWLPLLTTVLKKDFGFTDKEVDNIMDDFHEKYFLTNYSQDHNNVSRYVTKNTLYKKDKLIGSEKFDELVKNIFPFVEK